MKDSDYTVTCRFTTHTDSAGTVHYQYQSDPYRFSVPFDTGGGPMYQHDFERGLCWTRDGQQTFAVNGGSFTVYRVLEIREGFKAFTTYFLTEEHGVIIIQSGTDKGMSVLEETGAPGSRELLKALTQAVLGDQAFLKTAHPILSGKAIGEPVDINRRP